jgi:FkbM family methyltransferase
LAIEPEPENVTWLRKTVAENQASNVSVLDVALGDEDRGVAELQLGEQSGWHTLAPLDHWNRQIRGVSSSRQVTVRSLDAVIGELDIEEIAAIKIDVEGWELHVLKGAEQTLRLNEGPALLIELHPTLGVDPREVIDFLTKRGYTVSGPEVPNPQSGTEVITAARQ